MKFYNEMCEKLRSGEPFKFSRWGDGEWGCMKGWRGKNRDGNEYLPELKEGLWRIFNRPIDYYFGLQYGVLYNPELRNFVFKWLFNNGIDFVNGDILHQASEFGYLDRFVRAQRDRNVVFIAPEYFFIESIRWGEVFKHLYGFKIFAVNSYLNNDSLLETINLNIQECRENPVFWVAAAMNSNVIIDKLPDNVTAIDIGSVFDPYLGIPRARYQYKLKADWPW